MLENGIPYEYENPAAPPDPQIYPVAMTFTWQAGKAGKGKQFPRHETIAVRSEDEGRDLIKFWNDGITAFQYQISCFTPRRRNDVQQSEKNPA